MKNSAKLLIFNEPVCDKFSKKFNQIIREFTIVIVIAILILIYDPVLFLYFNLYNFLNNLLYI